MSSLGLPLSTTPFLSVAERDPNRPPASLRILILSDLRAVPQRVAQLSQWIHAHNLSFTIDLILVIGVSRPTDFKTPTHEAMANQGNDSLTLAQLEHICARVIYVPGMYEHSSAWELKNGHPLTLTNHSHSAVAGPVVVAPDLIVVHRRYADGITEHPVRNLPHSWRHTLYRKLSPPPRYRPAPRPSAIVLCSSQLPNATVTQSKSMSLLRTVASLLSLNLYSVPSLDYILAVAPPKMQRVPNNSTIFQKAERTLDPGSFADGDFSIAQLVRPDIWDPVLEPEVDDEQLAVESAWWVDTITQYNLDRPAGNDDDEDDEEDEEEDEDENDDDDDEYDCDYTDDDDDDDDDDFGRRGGLLGRGFGFRDRSSSVQHNLSNYGDRSGGNDGASPSSAPTRSGLLDG